jgi:tetratricopeptide (TPR) repeat protein
MRSIPSVPAMNPLLEQGIAEHRRGNDRYAIECFTAALQKEADCVAAYACRAESYLALSEQGRALADINRALSLDPKNAVFYALRGNIYSVMEDTAQALADYDKAVALDPKESLFYFRRALLCLLTKDE